MSADWSLGRINILPRPFVSAIRVEAMARHAIFALGCGAAHVVEVDAMFGDC